MEDKLAETIRKDLAVAKIHFSDPRFFARLHRGVFKKAAAKLTEKQEAEKTLLEEYAGISQDLEASDIQDGGGVRGNLRARRLAKALINGQGKISNEALNRTIAFLKENLYSLGPERHHDAVRQEHKLNVLETIRENEPLRKKLFGMKRPLSNTLADNLIREALLLDSSEPIKDVHVKQAVLYAWLTHLRQNVGSCFATAPAIIIQKEKPEQFLTDVELLLNTGRLTRTYAGVEYSAPMSRSWGASDLRRFFPLTAPIKRIARSPGLVEAFQETGLIEGELSKIQKKERCAKIIKAALGPILKTASVFLMTPERLLRAALLRKNRITEQDVQDYESRAAGMMYMRPGVVLKKDSAKKKRSFDSCKTFLAQNARAQNSFKAITDNALLKSWEFTVACFSETKANFSQWNLYSSLGMHHEEPFGIGECLYSHLSEELERANREAQENQDKYEEVFIQVKYLEGRINAARTEEDVRWMRPEYKARVNEMNTCLKLRDRAHQNARQLANMLPFLIDQYQYYFTQYFQEIYDADMGEDISDFYDDRPAGFHLLYKHGRTNPSQWTIIDSPEQFVDCLAQFFVATEVEMVSKPELTGMQEIFSRMVTSIEVLLKTKEFLETALYRMAKAHNSRIVKDPLNNLDKVEKKPWIYTSGGSMDALLSCYYLREEKPTVVDRWVENETELLVFFLDSLKLAPQKVKDLFEENPKRSMLAHSPTHAFILKPGMKLFKEGWQSDVYTYTWLRENYIQPRQQFFAKIDLDSDMMQEAVSQMAKPLPKNQELAFKEFFRTLSGGSMLAQNFRDYVVRMIESYWERKKLGALSLTLEHIDGTLYSLLPFTRTQHLKDSVGEIFSEIESSDFSKDDILATLDLFLASGYGKTVFSAKELINICKELILAVTQKTRFATNYHKELYAAARKCGLAIPEPMVFADTNWPKDYFAFVVNPGTAKLELWRTDEIGSEGAPMTTWKQFIDGSSQKKWGVYTRPQEYDSDVPIGARHF